MNKRLKFVLISIVLMILGVVAGIISIMNVKTNLPLTIILLFPAILLIVFGINLLVFKTRKNN